MICDECGGDGILHDTFYDGDGIGFPVKYPCDVCGETGEIPHVQCADCNGTGSVDVLVAFGDLPEHKCWMKMKCSTCNGDTVLPLRIG